MIKESMIDSAVELLKETDWKSFSISTIIPKKLLAEEESKWDADFTEPESLKNSINSEIVSRIIDKTGMTYDSVNGDGRIVFDFSSEKVFKKPEPLFVFGRYRKFSTELAQTRWLCRNCGGKGCKKCEGKGRHYLSIEELIGNVFKKHTDCSDYSMHASGREDVDAQNTAGRPFVLELSGPKKREINLDDIEKDINSDKRIAVSDLKFSKRGDVELISTSHFDKEYEAEIEFEKNADYDKIHSFQGKILEQKTPTRVLHRRADIVRKRKIKEIRILEKREKTATILITAEPGTYIKEFISGDKGRTVPSISSELGVSAECKKLKVTKIFDDFLTLAVGL